MSFIFYAILVGALCGAFVGAWRHFPWFGPVCCIILVSFLGYGDLCEILARYPVSEDVMQLLPATIFFGLGGLSCLWVKYIPWGKSYGGALFFGTCGMLGLLYLKIG